MTRIEDIKERTEQATKGPWDDYDYTVNSPMHETAMVHKRADAIFIANARQDIPYLLALVDELAVQLEACLNEQASFEQVSAALARLQEQDR